MQKAVAPRKKMEIEENIEMIIKENVGDPQELMERLRAFGENVEYFFTHSESLREKYPDQFIAVNRGKIIAHHKDILRLMDQLDDKGINRDGIYVGNTYQRKLIIMKKESC